MTESSEQASDATPKRGARGADSHHHHHHRTSKGLKVGVRVVIILVLLVASGAVFGFLRATKADSRERTDPVPPVVVRAVPVVPQRVDRVWEGYGTARSMSRADVAAEVTGRVVERPEGIEPGRSVRAGELLIRIDPSDYEAALTRAARAAEALRSQIDGLTIETERLTNQIALSDEEIAAAERDLDRTRRAVEQGAGSQGEVDAKLSALRRSQREQDALRQQFELIPSRRLTLEAELAARQADVRLAETSLVRTRLRSPLGGEIQSVTPRVGDFVAAGTPVASVVDLSRVEVPLRLPASSASWVARVVGQDETVSLWTGPAVGRPDHVGRITRLAPEADPASRTITVFVEVEQDPGRFDRLLPGAFVQGRVRTPDPTERVVLPRRSIRSGRVFLIGPEEGDGRVVSVAPVETGYALDARFPAIDPGETEWVVLAPGAAPPAGSLVAVTALEQLQPGARVRVEGPAGSGEDSGTDSDSGADSEADSGVGPATGGEG